MTKKMIAPPTSYNVAINDFNSNMLTLVDMNVTITVIRKTMIFIEHGFYNIKMYYSNTQEASFVIVEHGGNESSFMNNDVNSYDIIDALVEYNNENTKALFDLISSFKEYKD